MRDYEINKSTMLANGCPDDEPTKKEIRDAVKSEGYIASKIKIWFNYDQGLYMWTCKMTLRNA